MAVFRKFVESEARKLQVFENIKKAVSHLKFSHMRLAASLGIVRKTEDKRHPI